jgi:hypothetical protein
MSRGQNGPSTSQTPYLVPTDAGVEFISLLSAGDAVPGATTKGRATWRFAGIPDGMGAFDNGDGTISVLVNHELTDTDVANTIPVRRAVPSLTSSSSTRRPCR